MRRIETIEDQMHGTVTFDLGDNQFVRLDARTVLEYGLEEVMRQIGHGDKIPTGRVNVMQRGRVVGTVPATFGLGEIKSASFLYDPRPGDFVRKQDHWEAHPSLGYGDLNCVSGFEPSRAEDVEQ